MNHQHKNHFQHVALQYLCEEFSEKTAKMDKDELCSLFNDDIRTATKFGLESENDIMGFVDIIWRLGLQGKNKRLPEWISAIMSSEITRPEQKIEMLRDGFCTFLSIMKE